METVLAFGEDTIQFCRPGVNRRDLSWSETTLALGEETMLRSRELALEPVRVVRGGLVETSSEIEQFL